MIKIWRKNWYWFGGILFVALSFFMGLLGSNFSRIQVILIYSFMAMLIHQFEEYAFPGGFPGITNIVVSGEKKAPERYPFNANQCWISNVFLTYTFYIVPVFFPNVIWLGLAQVIAGMLQLFTHGIMINARLKSPYNPGLGATVFLQLPIGIYYIWYVSTNNLANGWIYVFGIIGAFVALGILFLLPTRLMRSRESEYPFAEEEMYGFAKEKVIKMMKQ